MDVLLTLCAGVLLQGLPLADAAAQQDTIPASLLRRLAETADAGRTGQPMWIVVQYEFPHHVAGVYARADSAQAAARRMSGHRAYGPYRTPPDIDPPWAEAVILCPHDMYSTEARPMPDSRGGTRICPESPIPLEDVVSMRLVVQTRSRGTIEVPLPPREVDAVFFTLPAYDKFFVPYYTRLYGPAYAARLRAEIEEVLRRRR